MYGVQVPDTFKGVKTCNLGAFLIYLIVFQNQIRVLVKQHEFVFKWKINVRLKNNITRMYLKPPIQ